MNTLNRVLVVISSIVLALFALAVVLLPRTVLGQVAGWFESAKANVEPFTFVHFMVALGAVVVIFLLAFLALAELAMERHTHGRSVQIKSGEAELEVEAIARRLTFAVERVEGVLSASPQVASRGKSIDVKLPIAVQPESDLSPVVEAVNAAVRTSLEKTMGVRLHRLALTVSYPQAQASVAQVSALALPDLAVGREAATES